MLRHKSQRRFQIAITCLLVLVVYFGQAWCHVRLGRGDFFTGYVLLGTSLCLMLLSLRKRLLVLPLGRVVYWMQAHQYLGMLALATFVMHVRFPIHGLFESVLATVFLAISASGILGWYWNRTTPKRLLATGKDYSLAEIPQLRFRISQQAYAIALTAAGKMESSTLAEHYAQFLAKFFQRPRTWSFVIAPHGGLRRSLLHDLEQLDRYLGPSGKQARTQLSQLVKEKDDLDFHHALQTRLRLWVTCHVALVWFYFALVAVHVTTVWQFAR